MGGKKTSASLFALAHYALEITGKGIGELEAAKALIPQGTPINIAFLGNERHDQRINAARVIRHSGFEPVPILSSRRLRSLEELDVLVGRLIDVAAPSRFMLVGGDPTAPQGPFADSLALMASGIIRRHAIRHVGIAGYPEGHPRIDDKSLWRALKWKVGFLREEGCTVEITTQFGFDAESILRWIVRLRSEGVDCTVRVGVPGPATVGRLLRFASQFGVISSAGIVRQYGFSLTNLLQRVGPEQFVDRLVAGSRDLNMGRVLLHIYPFGGIVEATAWIADYLAKTERR